MEKNERIIVLIKRGLLKMIDTKRKEDAEFYKENGFHSSSVADDIELLRNVQDMIFEAEIAEEETCWQRRREEA